MDKDNLLKIAFDDGKVPASWSYCFNSQCPKSNECVRFMSTQYLDKGRDAGYAIYPNACQGKECRHFMQLRVIKSAWGFDKLFKDVRVCDAPTLRAKMKAYLGSKGQYYRYKLGQLRLTPEQQGWIKSLFGQYGYVDVEFDNFKEEIDFCD